jgi:hypothetical protein
MTDAEIIELIRAYAILKEKYERLLKVLKGEINGR